MYSASIDKLRSVLVAMQTTSSKRADLEQRLRGQLELRVQQLQQSTEERDKNDAAGEKKRVGQLEIAVTALEADVVKVLYTSVKLVHIYFDLTVGAKMPGTSCRKTNGS